MKQLDYSETRSFDEITERLTPAFVQYLDAEWNHIRSRVLRKMKVLEVGCGSGRVLRELAPLVSELVGLDHSYAQVEATEKTVKEHKLANVRIIYADATDLPFGESYFDMSISAFNTFGNLSYDKFRALKEMRRVTKPRGRILLSVYGENAAEFQKEMYDNVDAESRVLGDFTIYTFPDGLVGAAERFSEKKLRKLFTDSGFSDFRIERLAEFGYMCDLRK